MENQVGLHSDSEHRIILVTGQACDLDGQFSIENTICNIESPYVSHFNASLILGTSHLSDNSFTHTCI